MTSRLLRSTAIIFFLACAPAAALAEDYGEGGYFDRPTTFLTFEDGYVFNSSPNNSSFVPDVDKLGGIHDVPSIQPGDDGWHGRVAIGQSLNADWDYKVSLSAMILGEDTSFSGYATSTSQDLELQTLDVEVGYHPDNVGPLETRLFAGLRGIRSESALEMKTITGEGGARDSIYAAGPRLGMDLAIPLNDSSVAMVGSVSGSVLFGSMESVAIGNNPADNTSGNRTIWNVESMAGLSFAIGERADFTLGYRSAYYGGLATERSDITKVGSFDNEEPSDVFVHGPFGRLTIELP